MAPVWFRATKATCLSLPPKCPPERIRLPLSCEAQTWYDAVAANGEVALGRELSLAGDETTRLRLQQIAGGHLPHATGTYPLECSKLAWITQMARDVLLGDRTIRVIVWCRFNDEVYRVAQQLKEELGGSSVIAATGDMGISMDAKRSFNSRDESGIQVIVAQLSYLFSGHNLQAADINVYFSNSYDYIVRAQSEDRSHRQGRDRPVRYIDLIAVGTEDENIIRSLDLKGRTAALLTPETLG